MKQPFYQTPKHILQMALSSDAKLLLIELLDKVKLSMRPENQRNFTDKAGRPFVRMAQSTMCTLLRRSAKTVRKSLNELISAGLLLKKRIGLGCCNIYYLSESLLDSISPTERELSPASDRYAGFSNNNNPKKNHTKDYVHKQKQLKNERKRVYAHQYTQNEYTREELSHLIEVI